MQATILAFRDRDRRSLACDEKGRRLSNGGFLYRVNSALDGALGGASGVIDDAEDERIEQRYVQCTNVRHRASTISSRDSRDRSDREATHQAGERWIFVRRTARKLGRIRGMSNWKLRGPGARRGAPHRA